MHRKQVGLVSGIFIFTGILFFMPETTLSTAERNVSAIAAMMATFWMTEALPIAVTALLPIILFPLLGVTGISEVSQSYSHKLIFLFLGGFWIAAAIEHSGAHQRIALTILRLVGARMDRIILGFMAATAFLSMWLSNTATTMMILPIAMAVIARAAETDNTFGRSLMLGIAYSASIGGVATLIGTPPNAVLAGVAENMLGISIPFWKWMLFGVPVSVTMFIICWWYLTHLATALHQRSIGQVSTEFLHQELKALGNISRSERRVLSVFLGVAGLWIFKSLLPFQWLNDLDDSVIAISGALCLFIIPTGEKSGEFLMDWTKARQIPWEILILFGGGFALATGFQTTGLTQSIGLQLSLLQSMHWIILIGVITLVTIFLTEVTSNTATASMLLPVVAGIAGGTGENALVPMVATAVAASFAFMLPVATPPNAIVFASRQITIGEMARAGVWMNLLGALLIILGVRFLIPIVW